MGTLSRVLLHFPEALGSECTCLNCECVVHWRQRPRPPSQSITKIHSQPLKWLCHWKRIGKREHQTIIGIENLKPDILFKAMLLFAFFTCVLSSEVSVVQWDYKNLWHNQSKGESQGELRWKGRHVRDATVMRPACPHSGALRLLAIALSGKPAITSSQCPWTKPE